MTETFTNEVKLASKECFIEEIDCPDGLDDQDNQFYKSIASELNSIQIRPSLETIRKIIIYSRRQQ